MSDFGTLLASSSKILSSAQRLGETTTTGTSTTFGSNSTNSAFSSSTFGTSRSNASGSGFDGSTGGFQYNGFNNKSKNNNSSNGGGHHHHQYMPSLKRSLQELSNASLNLGILGSGGANMAPSTTGNNTMMNGNHSVQNPYNNNISNHSYLASQQQNNEGNALLLLAKQGNGFDVSRLERNIRQLEQQAHMRNTNTNNAPENNGSGMYIDGSSHRQSNSIATSSALRTSSIKPSGAGIDLESYLKNRHDQSISRILTNQRRNTYRGAEKLIQKRLTQELYDERQNVLRDLAGYRPAFGSEKPFSSSTAAEYGILDSQDPTASGATAAGKAIPDKTRDAMNTDASILINGQRNFIPTQTKNNINNNKMNSAAFGGGSKLTESARRHASIIANLNNSQKKLNANSSPVSAHHNVLLDLSNQMQTLATSLNNVPQRKNFVNTAYVNAITLFQFVISRRTTKTTTSTNNSQQAVIKLRAEGTLAYLCHQFRMHIMESTSSSSSSGKRRMAETLHQATQSTLNGSFANDISMYVDRKMGMMLNNASTDPSLSQSVLESLFWTKIYFCLRSGDAKAALEIFVKLSSQNNNNSSTAAMLPEDEKATFLSIITLLAEEQSNNGGTSIWDSLSPRQHHQSQSTNSMVPSDLRQSVLELYYKAKENTATVEDNRSRRTMSISTPNPSTITNEYKLATLALLSSAEPLTQVKALSGTIVSTIEDYLFSYLWDVVQPSSPSSAAALPQNWNDKIRKLSNIVKRWGPQYFEAENESVLGGWGYTMPLLLTQQYESALIHLAEHGKNKPLLLSQSTHLGILLEFAGIELVDLKPQQDGAERRMLGHSISSMQLLTSLLVSYSVSFQSVDPEAALEYLVRIPPDADNNSRENNNTNSNKSSTEKHVARLIRETRAFETLVGSVSIDGTRVSQDGKAGGGALDAHFSPSEVSSILLDAAQSFVQESNVKDAAELLALAGRYSDLIMLLNRELGSLLVVSDGDQEKKEQREFWNNVSIQFYNAYLSSGRTHVQEVLESENNMHLLETFKQLLNLMEFFNRCSQHNWSEAWSLINELKLIPSSDQDIPYQLDSFGNYDESLKKSFHFTVLASMECLYHQYTEAKNNGNALLMRANGNDMMHDNSNSSGMMIQQHLDELRRRARILVTYAGLLQMESSAETHARIARMEAYMM